MEEIKVEEKKDIKPKRTKEQKKHLFLIIFGSILSVTMILFLSIYFVAGSYFFGFALESSFEQTKAIPKDAMEKLEQMPLPETNREWLKNANITIANIKSKDDGFKLNAFEILQETNNHLWVISIHGYRGKSLDNGHYAKEFFERGYNVLLPDLEAHGFSEGTIVGMGYSDRFDILGWIDYIINKDNDAKIVLHGVSMGGATVMMTTGEKLPSNVKCAIEDCGYSNVYDIFKHVADEYLSLPFKRTLLSALDLIAKIKLGIHLKQADCVEALKRSTTPTMFIHGTADNFVPFWMLDIVYNANENIEKEKLVVEGANHAYSATYNPDLYFNEVFEFVEKYVK